MRSKLLQMLMEHQGEFVSGEAISQFLGCSRTAVWKHIEELRKAGYELEAVPRKGYRITHQPNVISESEIKARLSTKLLGKHITYEKTVSSTQEIALKLATNGAPEGTIVVSDEQTGGKGRLGRPWYSPVGTGIWMSLIIRPKIAPQRAPQLTLLAAVAVIRGIKTVTSLSCDIKWPNDILLNGKKLVGILTEMQADPDQVHSVIVGIGINVNQTFFPEDINDIATSLQIEAGTEINRANLMTNIIEEFEQLYEMFIETGFHPIKSMWEAHAVTVGKKITARMINGSIHGLAKGITDEGILLLEDDHGEIHHIYSADIQFDVTNW